MRFRLHVIRQCVVNIYVRSVCSSHKGSWCVFTNWWEWGGGGCGYIWSVSVVIRDVDVCLLSGGGGVIIMVMCEVCVL